MYYKIFLSFYILSMLFPFSGFSYSQSQADTAIYSIDKCVNQFDSSKTEKTKAGFQYWFADKNFIDGRTLKLSVVAAGMATHAPHKHTEDEFFFVIEGEADFYLNGEHKTAGPMTSLYCPPNIEHGIKNAGKTELKYLVIKKYVK